MSSPKNVVVVRALPIRLGQFLKLAELVQDGFEAKIRIQAGEAAVNGQVETRRGRQLHHNDVVQLAGQTRTVTAAPGVPNGSEG